MEDIFEMPSGAAFNMYRERGLCGVRGRGSETCVITELGAAVARPAQWARKLIHETLLCGLVIIHIQGVSLCSR